MQSQALESKDRNNYLGIAIIDWNAVETEDKLK